MAPADAETRVCVAQVGGAHGIRGEVRLKTFTAEPDAVARYRVLESEDGARRFEIVSLRPGKGVQVARIKGVGDRNAAEALRNLRLYVPRAKLAAPAEDEFYHADLVGLAAVTAGGAALGMVIAVQNFGAGDLLEIAPPGGGPSVFAPFTKAVVPVVDIAGGRLVLDPPAGLFDEPQDDGGQKGSR